MIEWLLGPIDSSRVHDVSESVAWHARAMVAAWVILLPTGVLVARFFKITRRQDWPRKVDNRFWWWTHLGCQYAGGLCFLGGLWLVLAYNGRSTAGNVHEWLGWSVIGLGALQFIGGWTRGTKGGPSALQPDGSLRGDHYDMTPRRRAFEAMHKVGGYLALALATGAVVSGLWLANAPRWMWIAIALWWLGWLALFVVLQRQGRAIDTYQAIWGPGREHPGNLRPRIGWGMRRPGDDLQRRKRPS